MLMHFQRIGGAEHEHGGVAVDDRFRNVTPQMAVKLSVAFGTSAMSWLNMETAYDVWHAERSVDTTNVRRLQAAV